MLQTLYTILLALKQTIAWKIPRFSVSSKTPTRTGSGSVVECLTQDWGVAGSSLTGISALCPWARHIYPCLVPVQPRKTCPDIMKNCWRKESNKQKQNSYMHLFDSLMHTCKTTNLFIHFMCLWCEILVVHYTSHFRLCYTLYHLCYVNCVVFVSFNNE